MAVPFWRLCIIFRSDNKSQRRKMQLSFADLFRISWNYQQHLLETNIYVGNRLRKNYESDHN